MQYGPREVEPQGEAWSNFKVAQVLAARLGIGDKVFGQSPAEIVEAMFQGPRTGHAATIDPKALPTAGPVRIAPEGGRLPAFEIAKPLTLWINDGLMAVFFFLVGMEIKREVLAGHLASVQRAALPAIGAVGGVIAPALIYLAVARADPSALRGWAIPMATDIAFAVAVAVALGRAVPPARKD